MVRWEIDPRRRSEPPFAVVQHVVAFIPEPRGGEVDEQMGLGIGTGVPPPSRQPTSNFRHESK